MCSNLFTMIAPMPTPRRLLAFISLTFALVTTTPAAAETPEITGNAFDLGDRLELFVDRHLIESLSDVRLVLQGVLDGISRILRHPVKLTRAWLSGQRSARERS